MFVRLGGGSQYEVGDNDENSSILIWPTVVSAVSLDYRCGVRYHPCDSTCHGVVKGLEPAIMEKLTNEMAIQAIKGGIPFLLSGPDGAIYEANQAFCELVGYSESQLKAMGWIKLSVNDEDLDIDRDLSTQLISGQVHSYQQWKSFKHRFGAAIAGQLMAIRYPPDKEEFEYCLCWFTPLINGSKAALDTVMKYIESHTEVTRANSETIKLMAAAINSVTPKTKFRAMMDSVLDWSAENPKYAFMTFLFMLALNPFPYAYNWATKQGWLPAQQMQIQIRDEKTGHISPANEIQIQKLEADYAQSIANFRPEEENQVAEKGDTSIPATVEVTTKSGNRIIFGDDSSSTIRQPVSGRIGHGGWNDSRDRRASGETSGGTGGGGSLHAGTLRERAVKEQ